MDVERLRRVVTGLDADGRSTIATDAPSPHLREAAPGVRYTELWSTGTVDAADEGDVPLTLVPGPGGTLIRVCELHPPEPGDDASFGLHATPTVDYIVVLEGALRCTLEDGSAVDLAPGDTLVQRGTQHAWTALGSEPCLFLAVIVDAS